MMPNSYAKLSCNSSCILDIYPSFIGRENVPCNSLTLSATSFSSNTSYTSCLLPAAFHIVQLWVWFLLLFLLRHTFTHVNTANCHLVLCNFKTRFSHGLRSLPLSGKCFYRDLTIVRYAAVVLALYPWVHSKNLS